MKNRRKMLIAILPVLACFALLPGAQAQLTPPPDGCYPNFNTAEGCDALNSVTGSGNTGLGWRALFFDTDGSFNTAVGGGALVLNNGGSDTAVGAGALLLNTTGVENTAVGTDALVFNSIASNNNAVGVFALFNNDSSGTGSASFNNAHGRNALFSNIDGTQNNAFGDDAMEFNTTGSFNTAMGDDALDGCVDGSSNVAVGDEAGTAIIHSNNNIAIGAGVTGGGGPFEDVSNTCFIGSIFDEPVSDSGSAQAVYVDQFNVLGFLPSSRQFKHDIQPMDNASEALFALKPVTFKYNGDKKATIQFGLIAEEVAKVSPDLVARGKSGIDTVRYEQVNAMLLNEFLKEHKKVEEQQANISQLKSEMQTMVAQLKEQAAQIQKVSAELQVNKPAPQVVANKP